MRIRRSLFALVLWLLSGCASSPLDRYLAQGPALPPSVEIADVPFHRQTRHHCGPAATAMLLAWAGRHTTPDALAAKMFTPGKEGTFQTDIVGAVRREGYLALPLRGFDALFRELSAGNPVMVLENLGFDWYPRWHYAVVLGYDLTQRELWLHSGDDERAAVGFARFERDWAGASQWGLVILPPGMLAESADEIAHLEAASGLERVGHAAEAEKSYLAILDRWPHSLGAAIGVGNTRFARGDARGAARALEAMTPYHPQEAALWHNLAIAYDGAHRTRLAKRSARKALALAPPADSAIYRANLAGILRSRSR